MMGYRIATYNIHRCVGRDGIENSGRIAAVLREINADIVALQEVTSYHEAAGDMLGYLAAEVEMEPIGGFTLTAAGAHYGNALLSKLPVSAIKRINISVAAREPRGVIQAAFGLNRQTIILWATHLGLGIRERHLQVKELLKIIHAANADVGILLGDFNEWLSWSRPLRALHRWFTTPHSTPQVPATFPSRRPLLRLDRIWIRPAERLTTLRAHSTELSRVASDHLPLVADIIL
jgi:endonuclease/exonuclease/phosphatase family metal-dependent hydrolase